MYTLLKKMPSKQLKMVVLLILGFSRQEYWSRWPFPSPGALLDPGIKSGSPTVQADFFNHLSHQGIPNSQYGQKRSRKVIQRSRSLC